MESPGQLGLNLNTSLIANALVQPNKMEFVYDYTGGYNMLSYIIDRISDSQKVDGQYGKIEKPLQGLGVISAEISTTSAISATAIQVNFVDPTYAFFRVRDNVINNVSANIHALVYESGPGYVKIKAIDDSQTLSTGNYPANSFLTMMWNSHGYVSNGMQYIPEVPAYDYNWTEKTRETVKVFRDDDYKTWVRVGENKYWVYAEEKIIMDRFSRMIEHKALWGVRAFNSQDLMGTNGGLFWSICNPIRGGINYPFTSLPTLAQFQDFINQIADRVNQTNVRLTALVGRGMLAILQSFTTPFVQASGIFNTFGEEMVKGIDTYTWSAQGITIDFILLPALSNRDLYPAVSTISGLSGTQAENFCFVIDTGAYTDISGRMTLPAMQRIYSGKQEMLYKVIPGVIEGGVSDMSDYFPNVSSEIAVTDEDSTSLQIYTKSGVDIMAYKMGVFYPAF